MPEPGRVAEAMALLMGRAPAIFGGRAANEPPCFFELEPDAALSDFYLGRFAVEVVVVQASQSSQEGSTSAALQIEDFEYLLEPLVSAA